jgi:hypothetical protein
MSHEIAVLRAAAYFLACILIVACTQNPQAAIYPSADFRPPGLIEALPANSKSVVLVFDESVVSVSGSLAIEPTVGVSCRAEDKKLLVDFGSGMSPGADYALGGEVEDGSGNRTRFLVRFSGWNDRAPSLRLSEVQTGKNSSKVKPHRDFVELEALADGNLGGEELSWSSSVKSASYRFPGAEVKKGDFIVLHLAPEGLDEERDEIGSDLAASGGIDSSGSGRDFWCKTMPLPDESGAVAISLRPGEAPYDGLFYADEGKSGAIADGKLADLIGLMAKSQAWPLSGENASWEDGFIWKASTSKSICRTSSANGPSAWSGGASGKQSPGRANP